MMDTVIEHAALIFDQSWLMALQIEDTIPQCGNGFVYQSVLTFLTGIEYV